MATKVTVVDHGAGNLRSVARALEHVGATVRVSNCPREIGQSDRLVVPGQGAFADCMTRLRALGLDDAIREFVGSGRPYLGICLGLQILFDWSHEHGSHRGLGLLPGVVSPLPQKPGLKIPHMGWNTVCWDEEPIAGMSNGAMFYFVHSFHAVPAAPISCARTEHGVSFVSALSVDNVLACQFHPEKSARVGLDLLAGFAQ